MDPDHSPTRRQLPRTKIVAIELSYISQPPILRQEAMAFIDRVFTTIEGPIKEFELLNAKESASGFSLERIVRHFNRFKDHELRKCLVHRIGQLSVMVTPSPTLNSQKLTQALKYVFICLLIDWLASKTTGTQELSAIFTKIFHDKTAEINDKIETKLALWFNDLNAQLFQVLLHTYKAKFIECYGASQANLNPQIDTQMAVMAENCLKILRILFRSNQNKQRVAQKMFIVPQVAIKFDPRDQYKIVKKNQQKLSLLNYQFVMPIEFKYALLQIESHYQQQITINKNLHEFINGAHLTRMALAVPLELVFLHFQVDRNDLLNDSMAKLCKVKQSLKSPMKISFKNEPGQDEGGVKKEYFQLIVRQLFGSYLDMFIPKQKSRLYWFNANSFQPPIRFQFVGTLMGLAIYNGVNLDMHFPTFIYKKLLKPEYDYCPENLEDLKEIEPEIYASLKKMLDPNQPIEELMLTFTIQLDNFGEITVKDLVEDGVSIPVTRDNVTEYVQAYADFLVNRHIERQFKSFKKGFEAVVNGLIIHSFTPQELEAIVCGTSYIDLQQLKDSTRYEGYKPDDAIIKNLWSYLFSLNQQDKRAFLTFVTGSQRVPIDGMKSLKFVIQKDGDPKRLPTARTCFNVFLLPAYEKSEHLETNMRIILKNYEGFGLI